VVGGGTKRHNTDDAAFGEAPVVETVKRTAVFVVFALTCACEGGSVEPVPEGFGRPGSGEAEVPNGCTPDEGQPWIDEDWHGTGIEVAEIIPHGWDPATHPTLLFGHGNGFFPESYTCYGEILGRSCVRTVLPRQWNTDDGDYPHLGWEARELRWESTVAVYDVLSEQQDTELIFVGGHSMGAYTALLAAGADSRIGEHQAGNCEVEDDETTCEPLEAAGYVIVSGWPAQGAMDDPPFWFAEHAFAELRPDRFVAYGELDESSGDACLDETPPVCRADSYWIDADSADDLHLKHVMLPSFEHEDLACGPSWIQSHAFEHAIVGLVYELEDWIWNAILDDDAAAAD
jgi:pimeloyl-ACP methyl ester carboxylesterase